VELGRRRGVATAAALLSMTVACAQSGDDGFDVAGRGGAGSGRAPVAGSAGVSGAAAGMGGTRAGAGGGGAGGSGGRRPVELLPNAEAILMAQCARWSRQSLLLPSNLLLVVDRSASMSCNPPPITDSVACEAAPMHLAPDMPSKWQVMREALRAALLALPDDTVVGLSYFSNDDACGVHSLPSVPLSELNPRQRSALRASLDNVQPDGATPLVGASVLAYKHLHAAALAGEIRGGKYVVLITDGEQSEACSDSMQCSGAVDCTRLLTEVEAPKAAGHGVGIKTFVIGVPGSEASRTTLSQLAMVGGTARPNCDVALGDCHFDMTHREAFGVALEEALGEIAGRRLDCELSLPIPDDEELELDPDLVNVVHSPAAGGAPRVIPQDVRAPCDAGADGWQYTDDGTRIRLCGPTCEQVRADRGARLDVVIGCPVRGVD
jgi:hypothetical protein